MTTVCSTRFISSSLTTTAGSFFASSLPATGSRSTQKIPYRSIIQTVPADRVPAGPLSLLGGFPRQLIFLVVLPTMQRVLLSLWMTLLLGELALQAATGSECRVLTLPNGRPLVPCDSRLLEYPTEEVHDDRSDLILVHLCASVRWLCTYSPVQQYRGITTNACIGVLQGPRNSVSAVCTTERGVCRNSVARSVSRVCRPRSRLRVIREEVSCVLVRRPSG